MKTIALFNQKGGVGKTTSTVNIGAGLARLGKRILLIDMDPQANLTVSLGFSCEGEETINELLAGQITLDQAIKERDGMRVIPSGLQLAGAELQLAASMGREKLLQEALEGLPADFDYILIDCPPSLGLLTLNALAACDGLYIPIEAEFLPMQGLRLLMDTVKTVKKRINPKIEIAGVITTFCDPRKNLQRTVIEQIKARFGDRVFNSTIRVNVSLAEAPSAGQTIFEYSPGSHGAADYMALCQEIIAREGGQNG